MLSSIRLRCSVVPAPVLSASYLCLTLVTILFVVQLALLSSASQVNGAVTIVAIVPMSLNQISACQLAMNIAIDGYNSQQSLSDGQTYFVAANYQDESSNYFPYLVRSLAVTPGSSSTLIAPILISVLNNDNNLSFSPILKHLASQYGMVHVDRSASVNHQNSRLLLAASNIAFVKEIAGWQRVITGNKPTTSSMLSLDYYAGQDSSSSSTPSTRQPSAATFLQFHGVGAYQSSRQRLQITTTISSVDYQQPNYYVVKESAGWQRIAVVVDTRPSNIAAASTLVDLAGQNGLSVTFFDVIGDDNSQESIELSINQLIETDSRIIVLHLNTEALQKFLCDAYLRGLTGARYVFIGTNVSPRLIVDSPLVGAYLKTCSRKILEEQVVGYFFSAHLARTSPEHGFGFSQSDTVTVGYTANYFELTFNNQLNALMTRLNATSLPSDFELRYKCHDAMLDALVILRSLDRNFIVNYRPWNASTFDPSSFKQANSKKNSYCNREKDCHLGGRLVGQWLVDQPRSLATVQAWLDQQSSELRWNVTTLKDPWWPTGRSPSDRMQIVRQPMPVDDWFRVLGLTLAAISTLTNCVVVVAKNLGSLQKMAVSPTSVVNLVANLLLNADCVVELTVDLAPDDDVTTWCNVRFIFANFGVIILNSALVAKFFNFRRAFFHSSLLKSLWQHELQCSLIVIPSLAITSILVWANLFFLPQKRGQLVVEASQESSLDFVIYEGGCARTVGDRPSLLTKRSIVPLELALGSWHIFWMVAACVLSIETRRYWISSFMPDVMESRVFVFASSLLTILAAIFLSRPFSDWPILSQYVTSIWLLLYSSLMTVIYFGRVAPKIAKKIRRLNKSRHVGVARTTSLTRTLSVAHLNSMVNRGGYVSVTAPHEAIATLMARSAFTPTLFLTRGVSLSADERTLQHVGRTKSTKTVRFEEVVTIL